MTVQSKRNKAPEINEFVEGLNAGDTSEVIKETSSIGLGFDFVADTGLTIGNGAIAKKILGRMEEILDNGNNGSLKLDLIVGSNVSGSDLAYDCIILSYVEAGKCVSIPYAVAASRETGFKPLTASNGDEKYAIERAPSEVHDRKLIAIVKQFLDKRLSLGPTNITIRSTVILHKDFNLDNVETEMRKGLNDIIGYMRLSVLGTSSDISLREFLKHSRGKLNIQVAPAEATMSFDDSGIPIPAGLTCGIEFSKFRSGMDKDPNTMNTGSDIIDLGKMHIRTSVIHTGAIQQPGQQEVGFGQNGPKYQAFSPFVVIEEMDDHMVTLGRHLLTLGSLNAMLDPNIIRSRFDPGALGALNIHANLNSEANPGPIDHEDAKSNYNEMYNKLMSNKTYIGMVVKPGTHMFNIMKSWMTQQGRENILHTADHLFNTTDFTDRISANDIISPNFELSVTGTYPGENNQLRPLSEIDLLYVMNAIPNQQALINDWVEAHSGRLPPNVSLAKKKIVLEHVTEGQCVFKDAQYIVTFNYDMIRMLGSYIAGSGIEINANSMVGAPVVNSWGTYLNTASNAYSGAASEFGSTVRGGGQGGHFFQ